MTTDKHPNTEDFKRRELRLQQINLEIHRLQDLQHAMTKQIDSAISRKLRNDLYVLMDTMSQAIKDLTLEEQTLEEFLIENEAPGWASH